MSGALVLLHPIKLCDCGAHIRQAKTGPRRTCCAACSEKKHREKERQRRAADPEHAKDLSRGYTRAFRERNPDGYRTSRKQLLESNPLHYHDLYKSRWLRRILASTKGRARRNGISFDITETDLEVPVYCPVLGLKLEVSSGQASANSYSLDRIDPAKGYVRGNVWIISWRANDLKRNGTVAEFERLIAALKRVGAP